MSDEDTDFEIEDKGVKLFMGDVDDDNCAEVIKFIIKENFLGTHKRLKLIINSHGGECTSGFSVVDVILGSNIPVQTIGIGIIASMGLHIFISGKKGERVLTPNTLILSHQWAWGSYGKEHELLASVKGFNLLSDICMRHYKKHTGLSEKQINKHLMSPSDHWIDAWEAKELGLCDIVKDFE